jgi:hypothetical protein
MEITYKGFKHALALNDVTLKGLGKWVILIFAFTFFNLFMEPEESIYTAFGYFFIAAIYTVYNVNVNTPSVIATLPLSTNRKVAYIYRNLITTTLSFMFFYFIAIFVFTFISSLFDITVTIDVMAESIIKGNGDNMAILGSLAETVIAYVTMCMVIPLAFVRNKKIWYMSAIGIFIVMDGFSLILGNIANSSDGFVFRTSLISNFHNLSNCVGAFVGICVGGVIMIVISYLVSLKLANKNI